MSLIVPAPVGWQTLRRMKHYSAPVCQTPQVHNLISTFPQLCVIESQVVAALGG